MNTYNLFKYRAIDKNLLDSLIKGYIYFSEPENLNDPFDCQVDINDALNRAIEACEGEAKTNLQNLKNDVQYFISKFQKIV